MIRIDPNPSRRQLAVFGLAWLIFFGVLGGIQWRRHGVNLDSAVEWIIAVIIPAAGLVWPEFLRFVYVFAIYATYPIGLVVSFFILVVIYYIVLTPIALILRLTGYDPMQHRFDYSAKSYWTSRKQEEKTNRYFQQF
jgi:hypothetical protein